MSDWRCPALQLGEMETGANVEPAYTVEIRFTERRYCAVCRKTTRPDECMIVSMESDVIDAGSGASRQWFVPPSEDPGTKGQPCETKVAAPAAPAVPRFVFSSHFPAVDLAGSRSLSRRLMRLKETPGIGRVSSSGALQSNRRRNKRQLYYLLTGRTADSPRQQCVRPCGPDARGREPCWDRGVSCLCVAASLLTAAAKRM